MNVVDSGSAIEVPASRHGGTAWLVTAALAAQVALVAAPLVRAELEPGPGWGLATLLAPAMLGEGLLRRSAWALLFFVPLGWALPAYDLPGDAFAGALAPVALLTGVIYLVLALRWLGDVEAVPGDAGPRVVDDVQWKALASRGDETRSALLPWVAMWVTAAPALGAALWPGVLRRAAAGFPAQPHQVTAAVAVLGTLFGLVVVTGLARPRPPYRGSRPRAMVLATLSAVLFLVWAAVRG